jgi:hypothetical protein
LLYKGRRVLFWMKQDFFFLWEKWQGLEELGAFWRKKGIPGDFFVGRIVVSGSFLLFSCFLYEIVPKCTDLARF